MAVPISRWFAGLAGDVRLAARSLRRRPGFAALAIVTLTLGIGANTAIFTVGDAVFLQALPYPDAGRLVALRSVAPPREGSSLPDAERTSGANLADWQAQATSFEAIAGYRLRTADLTGGASSERLRGLGATPEYFDVFGVKAIRGRRFTAADRGLTAIILGRGIWRRRFGADPRIISAPLDVNIVNLQRVGPTPHVVLGVVDEAVRFPPLTGDFQLEAPRAAEDVDFWSPLIVDAGGKRDDRELDVVAKLKPGVSVARAQAEMTGIANRLAEAHPATNRGWGVRVVPLRRYVAGGTARAVVWLSACTAIVLLIACGNVASLLLARGLARRREVAVRAALGAGRVRIVRQFLVEALLLALPAAAAGLALTAAGIAAIGRRLPASEALPQLPAADIRVLAATALCALATALLAGAVPALRLSRGGEADAAELGGRGVTADRGSVRMLRTLVASEIALTLALLVATALFAASAVRLWRVDPGFNADRLLTMTISLPNNKFAWKHNVVFSRQVMSGVTSLPGVEDAAVVEGVPMGPGGFWNDIEAEGAPPAGPAGRPVARLRVVSPGYFRVMQIPVLAGRDFDARDEVGEIGQLPAVIVNRALAERYWPGAEAVGRRLHVGGVSEWTRVIGVVGDVRYAGLDSPPDFELYYPEALFPQRAITLLVRTGGDPEAPAAAIRSRIAAIDREAFVTDVVTMKALVDASLAPRRAGTLLLAVFAGIALVLTLTGIYGVMAQAVARRRIEIGIRSALGARRADILRLVVGEGLGLAAAGSLAGLAAAAAIGRALRSLLYGVGPADPVSFLLGAAAVAAVAGVASYVPARRAMGIDPAEALRE